MSSPRTLTDKEGSIHGILSFLRRAFGRGGALLSSLRQGNSHCPPLPAVRRAPARREPFLQRLRRSRRRRCSGCIRYAAAPPGSAARNSPGPGPHHHSPRTSSGTGSSTVSSAAAGQRPPRRGMRACCAEYGRFHRLRAALFRRRRQLLHIPRRRNVRLSGTVFHELHRRAGTHRQKRRNVVLSRRRTERRGAGPAGCADPHLCSRGHVCIHRPHHLFCLPRRRYASLYGRPPKR